MNPTANPLQQPPLSLYLHTPWCVRKCPYCDFNSHTAPQTIPEDQYLRALLDDLDADRPWLPQQPLTTLFIGGGTPSLMSPDFYGQLLDGLAKRLDLSQLDEITLEANPGTVEEARFRGFRSAGINRLSLGIQSFQPDKLHTLGRIHHGDDAHRAIRAARNAGFERINLDLMHGLPGQSEADALSDLDAALSWDTGHISWYQLTIEPNTAFFSRPPDLPDEDVLAAIQSAGEQRMNQAGLYAYEISAWGRPGQECRHNLNYWQFGDYLALGAGAHGKITIPEEGEVWRYWKTRQPEAYLNRIGSRTAGREQLSAAELPLDFLLNALRLSEGVPETFFPARTGLSLEHIQDRVDALRASGLLCREPTGRLATTAQGSRFLNDVLEPFVP